MDRIFKRERGASNSENYEISVEILRGRGANPPDPRAGAQAARPEDSNEMDRSNGLTLNSRDRTTLVIRRLQPHPRSRHSLASVSPNRTNMRGKASSC